MWVLVHVTDSVRPTDAFVTYPPSMADRGTVAAAEGMAALAGKALHEGTALGQRTDEVARRRHRKAHRQRLISLAPRKRA